MTAVGCCGGSSKAMESFNELKRAQTDVFERADRDWVNFGTLGARLGELA